jgi:hypothetical protein
MRNISIAILCVLNVQVFVYHSNLEYAEFEWQNYEYESMCYPLSLNVHYSMNKPGPLFGRLIKRGKRES